MDQQNSSGRSAGDTNDRPLSEPIDVRCALGVCPRSKDDTAKYEHEHAHEWRRRDGANRHEQHASRGEDDEHVAPRGLAHQALEVVVPHSADAAQVVNDFSPVGPPFFQSTHFFTRLHRSWLRTWGLTGTYLSQCLSTPATTRRSGNSTSQ